MMEKGKSEMEEEKKSYAEYEKFAETTTTEKARAISEASERIEALSASIDKAAADVDRLSAEIAEHDSVIDSTSTEMQNATSVRQKEAADFGTTLKDYDDSISAIGKAMTVLKEQPSSRPAALLQIAQLDRKISPTEASQYLDAFLKGHEERAPVNSLLMESQVPEAAGYEFQSGGVVSLLEKLEDQFKEERNTLKMEELKKKNSFKTLVAGLDSENSDAKKDKERKLQERRQRLVSRKPLMRVSLQRPKRRWRRISSTRRTWRPLGSRNPLTSKIASNSVQKNWKPSERPRKSLVAVRWRGTQRSTCHPC
eukprot:symbB.v1.2.000918.t1/scaffold27.1/size414596/26